MLLRMHSLKYYDNFIEEFGSLYLGSFDDTVIELITLTLANIQNNDTRKQDEISLGFFVEESIHLINVYSFLNLRGMLRNIIKYKEDYIKLTNSNIENKNLLSHYKKNSRFHKQCLTSINKTNHNSTNLLKKIGFLVIKFYHMRKKLSQNF